MTTPAGEPRQRDMFPASQAMLALIDRMAPLYHFMTASAWAERGGDPTISDFVVGNPHELPLPGYSQALRRWSEPRDKDWFAYTMSDPVAQEVVAASLQKRLGLPFAPDDVVMTNGAFAAIAVALRAVADPGDEVIFPIPPWFFYEPLIASVGAVPVKVRVRVDSFDLDIEAIRAAVTPRTRAIIVNSPNNPTGKIYPPETLMALARVLHEASVRYGRTIFLLSDEAYSRILFDERSFQSPTAFYGDSFLLYTYGKTLLTPGQRLGFIALPPGMATATKTALRPAMMMAQLVTGWAFPNALLQHALGDIEQLSIDVDHLQRKRDRMVAALREIGYELHSPEGTFYLLPRSPWPNDAAFVDLLAASNVFVLPGSLIELPGYVRISLTANDAMIDRALPVFAAALAHARASQPPLKRDV